MKNFVFIIPLFFTIVLEGQDFKRDLLAVNRKLGNLDRYSVTMKYAMFIDGKLDKPYSTKQIFISMDKDLYSMVEKNKVEVIENGEQTLYINHQKKEVLLNTMKKDIPINSLDEDKQEYNDMLDIIENNFDSLMTLAKKITVLSNSYPYKTYEVEYEREAEFSKAIYTIDLKNKVFKSIIISYSDPEYVRGLDDREHWVTLKVDYDNFNLNGEVSATAFDMSKYIEKLAKKNYVLKGNVKNYKLQII